MAVRSKPPLEVRLLKAESDYQMAEIKKLQKEVAATFHKVRTYQNQLNTNITALRRELRASMSAIERILDDPEARAHARAVIMDYFNTRKEKQ